MDCVEPDLGNLPRTVFMRHNEGKATFCFIDQRLLPHVLEMRETDDWEEVVDAVKRLAIRGAPAIGISGAAALALWAQKASATCAEESVFSLDLLHVSQTISSARPTAVSLSWAVGQSLNEARQVLGRTHDAGIAAARLREFVDVLVDRDERANRAIGENGAALLGEGCRILTHCNAGSLATAFYGTALGVVYRATALGKVRRVYADETRPVGQGARLTCWELSRAGVPVTLICDNMAASLMARGEVDAVIVGADRIASNGDTANKIGTYGLAVLAAAHDIPFYVAAPVSTVDFTLADGMGIEIEYRDPSEVLDRPLEGVDVLNPAFDVTPARLITAIVTEQGVFSPGKLATVRTGSPNVRSGQA